MAMGALTACEVTLTIRPNLRAIMPSMVDFINSIGASMLASSALIQVLALDREHVVHFTLLQTRIDRPIGPSR
jgi:hypothetical protein